MNNDLQSRSRVLPASLVLFAALLMALLLPLRLWQQIHLVEQDTGFWLGGGITVTLLYAGMGALAALPAAAAFALRKRTALDLTRRRRILEGVAAALLAAAMVWDAFAAFRFAVRLFAGYGSGLFFEGMESQASSPASFYVRSGAMAGVVEGVFGTLGALFFGELAIINFQPKKELFLSRAMALAPLVWVISRVLRRFSRTIAYLRVSDLFLELAMLVMLLLFFLCFAQLVGNYNGAGKQSLLFAAGACAAVLALVCFVPRLVTYGFLGFAAPQDAVIEWCDPAVALFILAFLGGRIYTKNRKET